MKPVLDPLGSHAYHEDMNDEQYDTLLNGILSLGTGQRRLTRLMMELAQASSEQEERIEQIVDVLRNVW